MKERRMMKKVFALVLALATLFTMSTTVFAAGENGPIGTVTGTIDDRTTVSITGLEAGVTVKLYQVAEGNYVDNGSGQKFTGYTWYTDATQYPWNNAGQVDALKEVAEKNMVTAESVTAVVNAINAATSVVNTYNTPTALATTEFSYTVGAGAYIAVITGGTDKIYNPVFLTATYKAVDGGETFVGGKVDTSELYGSTAVAKSSEVKIEKSIESGTVEDDQNGTADGGKIDTVSVGDVVSYKLKPTLPDYPANAVDKTLLVTDTLSTGLTLLPNTLKITLIKNDNSTVSASVNLTNKTVTFNNGTTNVTVADIVIVEAEQDKIYVNFDYEKLIIAGTNGDIYGVEITYNAIVNENAVVGKDGNTNTVKLYYNNEPTQDDGYTFVPETPQEPDPNQGATTKEKSDTETVYTYQLAFHKTGEGTDANALAGAKFAIYAEDGTLVDVVITDKNGYAVSSKVAAGTYKVKEIEAPDGYSLNTQEYTIEATWASATHKATTVTTETKYTSDATKALVKNGSTPVQAGWLVDNVFYAMDEYASENTTGLPKVYKAYIQAETTTSDTTEIITTNATIEGTILMSGNIENTKMSSLPSTGGVGTFIFTIAGCVIMVAAVAIFMVSKKKANN